MLNREDRQDTLIRLLADGATVEKALIEAGVHRRTAQDWRTGDGGFARRWEKAKHAGSQHRAAATGDASVFDPPRPDKPGYEEWLRLYTGFPLPTHLRPVAAAYEDRTNLVVLVLGPPGSGKDTTAGFMVAHASCDAYTRVAWIMEAEKFSIRRMNERIGPYFTDPRTYTHTPTGPGTVPPTRSLIDDYGPFKWEKGMRYPDGTLVERTRWSAEEKYFVGSRAPEADPNLWATGISGALYGSRVDLMVISDPFTVENQRSPTGRADQAAWIDGTVESRLDEGGRLIILGTRVAPYDNYGVLVDKYTRGARVIYEDGYYQKWSNGTATVIYPAIQHDPDGQEVSYWPERFPLDDYFELKDGTVIPAPGVTDERMLELGAVGATRKRGLRGIREQKPDTFETLYQQNPPQSVTGDFTRALLDHCDDPDRTLGVAPPGEILVLGVDPARSGGAGWVLWGWNPRAGTATVVDLFYGERLGMQGLREKLILDPVRRYMPRYFCYELSVEGSVLDHPDIKTALTETATELVKHSTGRNRSDSTVGLPGMVFKMRDGTIRFPSRTSVDRDRMRLLKTHFLAWDERTAAERAKASHAPDDLAMAAWVGFTKVREMMGRHGKMIPQREVTPAVWRAWGYRTVSREEPRAPVTDWVAEWGGDANRT